MTPKKKALIKALEKSLGVITPAIKSVGISRQTYYNWIAKDKEFKKAVEELPEIALDFAESQLLKQMKEGNTACIIFFLKTKGKCRGYREKEEEEKDAKSAFQSLPLEKRLAMIKILSE